MENFSFRYERILKLRLDEEDQCRNQLALRIKEEYELNEQLQSLRSKLESFKRTTAAEIEQGCTVQVLRTAEAQRKWLLESIDNQQFLIELKRDEVKAARVKLGEASKKRKIMEKLKENEYIQFQKEAELTEELATDQIVTFGSAQKQNR